MMETAKVLSFAAVLMICMLTVYAMPYRDQIADTIIVNDYGSSDDEVLVHVLSNVSRMLGDKHYNINRNKHKNNFQYFSRAKRRACGPRSPADCKDPGGGRQWRTTVGGSPSTTVSPKPTIPVASTTEALNYATSRHPTTTAMVSTDSSGSVSHATNTETSTVQTSATTATGITRFLSTSAKRHLTTFFSTRTQDLAQSNSTSKPFTGSNEAIPSSATTPKQFTGTMTMSISMPVSGTAPSATVLNSAANSFSDQVIDNDKSSTNAPNIHKTTVASTKISSVITSTATLRPGAIFSSSLSQNDVRPSPGFFDSASNIIVVSTVAGVFIVFCIAIIAYFYTTKSKAAIK